MWGRRVEQPLDQETVDGIIVFLMRIDDNVQRILRELAEEDDDGELEP